MAKIKGGQVRRGDILICKSFALGMTSTHAVIRAGQFLTGSPIRSNSVHAAIVTADGSDQVYVIESTGDGVNPSTCTVEADVFRYKGDGRLADRAASVAERLHTWTTHRKTSGGKPAGRYNAGRSAFSVVRPGYFGRSSKKLVNDVRRALDEDKDYADGFFCSMLVAICYDVAGDELGMPIPPIPKDPMNLNPSNLHAYLLNNPNDWMFIGTLNEPTGWGARIWSRESSH